MRAFHVSILAVLLGASASAAPPSVDVPPEVPATSDYVTVVPKTDAKAVSYVGLSGVDPFPSSLLKDAKTFVLPVRGLAEGRYQFAGVASLGDEHTVFRFSVVVGRAPQPPPKKDPVDPIGGVFYYFVVVRPDGPAHPQFTQAMSMPGWTKLRSLGHSFKDKTLSDARALGINLPPGTVLPAVVTLKINANESVIVRGPVPLPATDNDILKLPEGIR